MKPEPNKMTPEKVFQYTRQLGRRLLEEEAVIALDADCAFLHARASLKGKQPEGERAVAKPNWAKTYTRDFGLEYDPKNKKFLPVEERRANKRTPNPHQNHQQPIQAQKTKPHAQYTARQNQEKQEANPKQPLIPAIRPHWHPVDSKKQNRQPGKQKPAHNTAQNPDQKSKARPRPERERTTPRNLARTGAQYPFLLRLPGVPAKALPRARAQVQW